jgi:hypothetical protein
VKVARRDSQRTGSRVTLKYLRIGLICAAVAATSCAPDRYPLERPIGCADVLQLHRGQTAEEVRRWIGPPLSTSSASDSERRELQVERLTFYHHYANIEGFDYWDQLTVGFGQEGLVSVLAQRTVRGVGGQALAFSLKGDPVRKGEVRAIGPVFERVFSCGSGFSRAKLPSDVVVQR